jgi:hypothetical protein
MDIAFAQVGKTSISSSSSWTSGTRSGGNMQSHRAPVPLAARHLAEAAEREEADGLAVLDETRKMRTPTRAGLGFQTSRARAKVVH